MNNPSTGSVPAQVECVRGIPVIVITGRLLLDLSGLKDISSAGLRSIIQIIKHTSVSGGRTGIFTVPGPIPEILEISGFQRRLDIYPDPETALNGSSA
jgi:anti-anti-sigma factor